MFKKIGNHCKTGPESTSRWIYLNSQLAAAVLFLAPQEEELLGEHFSHGEVTA